MSKINLSAIHYTNIMRSDEMVPYIDIVDLSIRQLEAAIDDRPQCEANRVAMIEELRHLRAEQKLISIEEDNNKYCKPCEGTGEFSDGSQLCGACKGTGMSKDTEKTKEDPLLIFEYETVDTAPVDDDDYEYFATIAVGTVPEDKFPDATDDKLRAEQTKKARQLEVNIVNRPQQVDKPDLDPDRFWKATQNIAGGR